MNKPNVFKYATKELSQDAFIIWLLEHSNPEYTEVDPLIKEVSCNLLKRFFELETLNFPEKIYKLKISKQFKNIDILCRINDEFTIVVEDKTGTTANGDQLVRYKKIVQDKFPNDKILAIYFKTHDQSNYKKELKDGFKVFTRSDLIQVLNTPHNISNDIFNDFKNYINEIEEEVNSFVFKDQWNHKNWIGFFKYLQKELNRGDWGYVANQNGGFMGYWWAFQKNDHCWQYLQIQNEDLVIKINSHTPENDTKFRKKCYEHFLEKAKKENLHFEKPARFGKGETMTILKTQYLVRNSENNLIELDKTIEKLIDYTKFIEKYALLDDDFLS